MENLLYLILFVLSIASIVSIEIRYRFGDGINILEPLIGFGCKLLAAVTGAELMSAILPYWFRIAFIFIVMILSVIDLFKTRR